MFFVKPMTKNYIVLKDIGEPRFPTRSSFIHEVAHALHQEIDAQDSGEFSRLWFEKYSINRRVNRYNHQPVGWKSLLFADLQRSGSLEPYADYDNAVDQQIKISTSGSKNNFLSKEGLTLWYDQADLSKIIHAEQIMDTLLRDRRYLPERMARALQIVVFDPDCSNPHFNSSRGSEWYGRVRENIATHAERFTIAGFFPSSNKQSIQRIREEPKLQSKVEDLAYHGFIADDVAQFLLDRSAVLNPDCLAARQSGLAYPPFVGVIPLAMDPTEVASIDYQLTTWENTKDGLLVSRLPCRGKLFYCSSLSGLIKESRLAQKLQDFVLSRSDFGIYNCFIGRHGLFRDENIEAVWLYGPKISSAEEAVAVENSLEQEFNTKIIEDLIIE